MRTTRRFRVGGAAPSQARRFRLPPNERASAPFAPLEPDQPARTPTLQVASERAKYQYPERGKVETPARPARRDRAQIDAPMPARKGRRVLSFTAATEADMVAFLGTLRLKCAPENVDLTRLRRGVLPLAVDHNTDNLMGRIVEARIHGGRVDLRAEVGRTPRAVATLEEIDDGLRAGFSPGFIIHDSQPLDESDSAYDRDQLIQVAITRWEMYECSTTAIPRNSEALLRAGMGGLMTTQTQGLQAPEIVSIDDPVGLSISAGRAALRGGKGSAAPAPEPWGSSSASSTTMRAARPSLRTKRYCEARRKRRESSPDAWTMLQG